MIYEYKNCQYMNGRVNRKRIRDFYDPAVKFFNHGYHPIWNVKNRYFIIINFRSPEYRYLFEIEFARADLTELGAIPEMERIPRHE